MPDREKVIGHLNDCMEASRRDNTWVFVRKDIVEDAISMLKEQEAVEPIRIDGKRNHFIKCGNCNYDLLTGYLFCPHCGRSIKWSLN